jgi:hypothetical protein
MPTTIRTTEPRELLALVPYQLGFRPVESAVVVSLRRGVRVGLVARVDLADLVHPAEGPRVAAALVGHLLADGAGAVVLVLYSAADLQADESTGRRALAHLAAAAGPLLPEPTCWVVGPRGYHALGCREPGCCPPGGRPLADLEGARVGAEMVLLGATVEDDRADLGRLPAVDPAARRAARRAAARWAGRRAQLQGTAEHHRWRAAGLDLWRELVDGTPGRAVLHGRLSAALEDVLVRDAVLVDLVPGHARVADRVVAGWNGPEVGRALRAVVDPAAAVPPPVERLASACAVLRDVAAHRPGAAAPALTLLALAAWWSGDGARASVLVARALELEPGYRLADLVEQTLDHGVPPGWVRAAGA